MKGAYSHYFWFKFYHQVCKRLLYFHIIILNLNCSQKDIGVNFYCRAPFQSMITHLTSIMWRRLLIMMFPVHLVLKMIKSTHVVGSSNWKNRRSVITIVQMSLQPYRWQLLESETAFCDIGHKNCTSPANFVLHQNHVHLCLPLFVCPICHFTYITHSCLCMHITESHGVLKTAISLI